MTNPSVATTWWWAPHALPVNAPPARDVLIGIRDGRIYELRPGVSRDEAATFDNVTLHDDCVIAPGFVNTHSHIEYAPYDALVDGLEFADWIGDHIRRKRRLSPELMRAGAELGALQSLHAGITCMGDASYSGDAAHAMVSAGVRGRVYLEVFGSADALDGCLTRLDALVSSELVSHGISPHAPYTVDESLYRAVAATGMPWMTHLLESGDEVAYFEGRGPLYATLQRQGLDLPSWDSSPIVQLEDVLGPNVVAVHAVRASAADREVLGATGAGVAHCPRSNARLGCGVLDLDAMDRAGVMLGLGTDSPSSAGPLDMFAELRSALELHRAVGQSAERPTLAALLQMATLDAARVLGYDTLGAIDEGWHADLIAVHVGEAVADPLAAFVLGGGPEQVRAVMVAGHDRCVSDTNSLQRARERAVEARTLLALPVPVSAPH